MCLYCMHVGYICLLCMHGDGHCYNCVVMYKLIMLMLGCVFHECMLVVYEFVMHISVYMLLCMHCYGCGYAYIVG